VEKVDFSFIEPTELCATVRGVDVSITPLKVAELPRFTATLKGLPALVRLIAEAVDGGEWDDSSMAVAVSIGAIAEHGPALIEAVAVATRQPPAWVGELRADELAALASLAVRVNADFFFRALPAIRQQIEACAEALNPAPASGVSTGPTPSSS